MTNYLITALTEKTTLAGTDLLVVEDMAAPATPVTKKMTAANVRGPFQIQITGGNLIIPGTTPCDLGDTVTTLVNQQANRVNKFEKGESGQAELAKIPADYNGGAVAVTLKHNAYDINVLNSGAVAWDAAANVTCTAGANAGLYGSPVVAKFACAAGLAAGALIGTDVITSANVTGAKYMALMFYSTVALSAGDVQLLIDNTATCASPTKTWDIPAIGANAWTRVIIAAGDVSGAGNDAIISVGLKQVVDKGAMDLYLYNLGWTGTVTWQCQLVANGAGDASDCAFGTVQEISGDIIYGQDEEVTFPTITIGGTPAAGEKLKAVIIRKNNASDTHGTAKASFIGACITMTRG